MSKIDVVVVGATGLVGREFIDILSSRAFPVGKLYPVASQSSAGSTIVFGNKNLFIEDIEDFDFSKVQLAFFSAGSEVSSKYVPKAIASGATVIDNSSFFRMAEDVPLIVPEVNGSLLSSLETRSIIANPNCSTIQMAVALKPIYDLFGINKVNVSTYQSVSGAGRSAVDGLAKEVTELLSGVEVRDGVLKHRIAFNLIPQIDSFQDNHYTKEEMKMHWETQKIFADSEIVVDATCVRVPVFYGHALAMNIRTNRVLTTEMAMEALKAAPGILLMDDMQEQTYPMPIHCGHGNDAVMVGRVRVGHSSPYELSMWVVADNIRKGAALNAVQIAEMLNWG